MNTTRKTGLKTLLFLGLFMSVAISGNALAQNSGQLRIAIVDMSAALFNSNVAQEVDQRVQNETAADQQRIRNLATEAQSLQERLNTDGDVMSAGERQQLIDQIEEIRVQHDVIRQRVERIFEQRLQQFQQTYAPNLVEAISEVVDEGGFNLVLRAEAALLFSNEIDITARVTEKLNQLQP